MRFPFFLAALLFVNTAFAISEPVDTSAVDVSGWNKPRPELTFSWVSKDNHYRQFASPAPDACSDTAVTAWRGERIGIEALIASTDEAGPFTVGLSDFRDSRGREVAMPGSDAMFMRYVIANDVRSCGYQDPDTPWFTLPDQIDLSGTEAVLPAQSVRPVWCTVEVPRGIEPGTYTATLSLQTSKDRKIVKSLSLNVKVLPATLPQPHDYAFYLDIWQQPYAASRYYGVKNWSKEHFDKLTPYARYLARAGQKTITTILFYEPWGEQSNDKFEPMVETYREPDGSWKFDFDIFDRYVNFMDSQGIDGNIECFTMIPWQMEFRYIERPTGEYRFLSAPTNSAEYRDLWSSMLVALRSHLKEKGWFDRTVIFMDERGVGQMLDALALVDEVAPDFKIGLAGTYHTQFVDRLYNYTLASRTFFTEDEFRKRRDDGKVSLMYTCCANSAPSQFTSNLPADGAYIPAYCTAVGFDGYLHWSFQNWNNTPMTDTRFFLFGSGDTFFIYPDGRSSVRYERMVEGIQLSEKIRLLRQEFMARNDIEGLMRLENALVPIRCGIYEGLPGNGHYTSAMVVNDLGEAINSMAEKTLSKNQSKK